MKNKNTKIIPKDRKVAEECLNKFMNAFSALNDINNDEYMQCVMDVMEYDLDKLVADGLISRTNRKYHSIEAFINNNEKIKAIVNKSMGDIIDFYNEYQKFYNTIKKTRADYSVNEDA